MGDPQGGSIDELVMVWEIVCLGLFQTEIIEGRVKPLLGDTLYVMITLLRVEGQQQESKLLPPGLHILHAYAHLRNGSGRVSLVVRNVSNSHIFLKKGVSVARVVSASLVPPTELSPEMEAALGVESRPEPVSGSDAGKVAREIELGWVGPLVPRECSGSERTSSGLS